MEKLALSPTSPHLMQKFSADMTVWERKKARDGEIQHVAAPITATLSFEDQLPSKQRVLRMKQGRINAKPMKHTS